MHRAIVASIALSLFTTIAAPAQLAGVEIVVPSLESEPCAEMSEDGMSSNRTCNLGNGFGITFNWYDGRGRFELFDYRNGRTLYDAGRPQGFTEFIPPIGVRGNDDGTWTLTLVSNGYGVAPAVFRVHKDGACRVDGAGYSVEEIEAAFDIPCTEGDPPLAANSSETTGVINTIIGPQACFEVRQDRGEDPRRACPAVTETNLYIFAVPYGERAIVSGETPSKSPSSGPADPTPWASEHGIAGPFQYAGTVEWHGTPAEGDTIDATGVILPMQGLASDGEPRTFFDVRGPIDPLGYAATRDQAVAMIVAAQ